MKFSKTAVLIAGLLPLMTAAAPAGAATLTFDWTLGPAPGVTAGGIASGSGVLTANVTSSGDFVTSISGEIGGQTIVGLEPTNILQFTATIPDNQIFPHGSTFLSTKGLGIEFTGGTGLLLWSDFAQGSQGANNVNAYSGQSVTTAGLPGGSAGQGTFVLSPVSPVPLPASWTLLLLGACGLGFFSTRVTKNPASDDCGGLSAA